MKTKLLKKFRKEFNDSLKLELFCSSHDNCFNIELKTPYCQCTLGRYILDCFNLKWNINKEPPNNAEVLKWDLLNVVTDEIIEDYRKFIRGKVKEYKKSHPYRGFKIKFFKVRRR